MKKLSHLFLLILFLFTTAIITSFTKPTIQKSIAFSRYKSSKIQAAILLDVSNSMDGLIEQAKSQLWNMVSIMGKAQCDGKTPKIEIALYEYGRQENNVKYGYVKQISGFTTDLDHLSQQLFNLTTNGGDEYCGKVIYTSVNDLIWDTASGNYKVIFIAGNEDFLQGDVLYTKACNAAINKGIIVNTIYCGDKFQGIKEHWNLGSECGNGSYTNINQDAQIEEVPTPYDSLILTLNKQLNSTYISYGYAGADGFTAQAKADEINVEFSKPVAVKRASVKSNKALYNNKRWDIIDASADNEKFLDNLDIKTLPDSLQNKSRKELQQIVNEKKNQRNSIQNTIGQLSAKRETYLSAEKVKKNLTSHNATLETEIEKMIKTQATRFNMVIR